MSDKAIKVRWPRLLNVELVAEYTGVSTGTIRNMTQAGEFPRPVPFKPGRVLWDIKEIDEHIDTLKFKNSFPPSKKEREIRAAIEKMRDLERPHNEPLASRRGIEVS
jgi:predicted DNA-binding transcriptional regulator AlpA